MRRSLPVFAVLASLVVAGCVGPSDLDAATGDEVEVPVDVGAALVVHRGSGAAAALGEVPAVASVLRSVGVDAFEPTLGVAPDGAIYYAGYEGGVAVGFGPLVLKSADQGQTWEDVSPRLPTGHAVPPETNDPYVYVDPMTGRVFQFAMAPILLCTMMSWSDDGGASWTSNPKGCFTNPPYDHQTLVAAKPVSTPTVLYDNVLHQCVNTIYAAMCSRSLDGGLNWAPGLPAFRGVEPGSEGQPELCGGLHGHLKSGPDGSVYLPKIHCGAPMVAISRDDGTSWEAVRVADEPGLDGPDPAVAVDDAGNVYYAYVDVAGALLLTKSVDGGASWSVPVVASPPGIVAHIPALAAGSAGNVVLAYPGTPDLPGGYGGEGDPDAAAWHGYITITTDALAEDPLFQTSRVNPLEDPLVRGACGPGRCPGFVDFMDVVVGPDGRPYAAFVDACLDGCADGENNGSLGMLGTFTAGPLLRVPVEAEAADA